jgi:hypothetical protein
VPAAGGRPALFVEVAAPRALAIDKDDRVWVVSHGKDQLLRTSDEGKLEVMAAGRPFEFPSAVAVDAEGNAFICDTYAKAVWKVTPGKRPAKWFAGEPMVSPVALAWLGTDLVVVDPRAKAVLRIDPTGKASRMEMAQ